jgi:hypothetical protein
MYRSWYRSRQYVAHSHAHQVVFRYYHDVTSFHFISHHQTT